MTEQFVLPCDPDAPIDDDRNRTIHLAAACGDDGRVVSELSRGAKIDAENYLGWTPLMMATRNGHYKVAAVLLQHRADATRKNKFGISVFHLSITNGSEELILLILQYLLRGGVSKLSMESVLSPLSLAILFNRNPILTLLINKSFSVNAATLETGLTPLMFAAAMDNLAAYQILLLEKANANARNINHQTAQDIFNYKKQPKEQDPRPQPIIPVAAMLSVQGLLKNPSEALSTPTWFISPHLTPMTPLAFHQQQIFFPPDFSPGRFVGPANFYPTSEMAQTPMAQILTPVPQVSYYSSEQIDPSVAGFMQCFGDASGKTPV